MIYLTRELADEELLDAAIYARQVASTWDQELDESPGHVPNCCGDIRVEFLDDAPATEHDHHRGYDRYLGSVRIWSGESYYFKREDE